MGPAHSGLPSQAGQADVVELLLLEGVELDNSITGHSPMYYACESGSEDVFDVLGGSP